MVEIIGVVIGGMISTISIILVEIIREYNKRKNSKKEKENEFLKKLNKTYFDLHFFGKRLRSKSKLTYDERFELEKILDKANNYIHLGGPYIGTKFRKAILEVIDGIRCANEEGDLNKIK